MELRRSKIVDDVFGGAGLAVLRVRRWKVGGQTVRYGAVLLLYQVAQTLGVEAQRQVDGGTFLGGGGANNQRLDSTPVGSRTLDDHL